MYIHLVTNSKRIKVECNTSIPESEIVLVRCAMIFALCFFVFDWMADSLCMLDLLGDRKCASFYSEHRISDSK